MIRWKCCSWSPINTEIILLESPVRNFKRNVATDVLMDLTADFFNDVRLSVISWHRSLSKPVLHIRHWKERMDCQSLTGCIHLSSYVEYRWEVCRHLPLKNSCDVISVSGWNDALCFVVEISLFDMTPSTSALWKQKHPSLDKGLSWSCLRDAKESVSFHCRALQLVLQYETFFYVHCHSLWFFYILLHCSNCI